MIGAATQRLVDELDALAEQTFDLWNEQWVGFSWKRYFINHTRRVRALALDLAREEDADPDIVALSATLHDITKRYDGDVLRDADGNRIIGPDGLWRNEFLAPTHSNQVTDLYDSLNLQGHLHNDSGAEIAQRLLQATRLSPTCRTRVVECVRRHIRVNTHDRATSDREADVLLDADTLDANMGLVAFYRNIMIHCRRAKLRDGHAALGPYIAYLPSWLEMKEPFIQRMTTAGGKRRALARQERNADVCHHLMRELETGGRLPNEGLLSAVDYLIGQVDEPDLERDRHSLHSAWLPRQHESLVAVRFCDDLDREVAGIL